MTVPRILIIDDLTFWSKEERTRLCGRLGVADVTNGESVTAEGGLVALAVFASGQLLQNGHVINDIDEALRQVERGWRPGVSQRWSLVLLDLQFDYGSIRSGHPVDPDFNWPDRSDREYGLKILDAMSRRWPDRQSGNGNCEIPVVILSKLERLKKGKDAGRAGARAYVENEDLDKERLSLLLDEHGLIPDVSGSVAGFSPALLVALRSAREAARNGQGNLLLLGRPGSGKTVLAEYIHRLSPRRKQPFQRFTVGAGMNPDMLKAQLYGYWYGSHQFASTSEAGLAERAHRGTLFLDEIANLPMTGQTELLEFARCDSDGSRALTRFGSYPTGRPQASQAKQSVIGDFDPATQRLSVDVFLIAATNKPLNEPDFYKNNDFREDLFIRLGQESHRFIEFPSLSERRDDIGFLFERFLEEASESQGGKWPKTIDPEVVERLEHYHWPGNVAELKGVALEAEKASRNWDEVLGRHLPLLSVLEQVNPPSTTTIGFPIATGTTLREVTETLRNTHIGGRRAELNGALKAINNGVGELQVRLLAAALEETRRQTGQTKSDLLGDLNPTTALSLLLGRQLTTPQAADEIKRIMVFLSSQPDPASDVGRVFQWAQERRGQARKTPSIVGAHDDK